MSTASRRSGSSAALGHPVGDPGRRDLLLGPGHPGRHRRLRDQEGLRDLGGGQPADQPQGERDLGLPGQGGVAAGEHEPEPVVGDHVVLPRCRRGRGGARDRRDGLDQQRELAAQGRRRAGARRWRAAAPRWSARHRGCAARPAGTRRPARRRRRPGRIPRPGRCRRRRAPSRRARRPTRDGARRRPRRRNRCPAGGVPGVTVPASSGFTAHGLRRIPRVDGATRRP